MGMGLSRGRCWRLSALLAAAAVSALGVRRMTDLMMTDLAMVMMRPRQLLHRFLSSWVHPAKLPPQTTEPGQMHMVISMLERIARVTHRRPLALYQALPPAGQSRLSPLPVTVLASLSALAVLATCTMLASRTHIRARLGRAPQLQKVVVLLRVRREVTRAWLRRRRLRSLQQQLVPQVQSVLLALPLAAAQERRTKAQHRRCRHLCLPLHLACQPIRPSQQMSACGLRCRGTLLQLQLHCM